MRKVLIIQNKLPPYREFLWDGLRKSFSLYLAEADSDRLFLVDGSATSFRNYKFSEQLDCLVVSGGIREFRSIIPYIIKYRAKSVVAWTQFVGKNKSLIFRVLKSVYLLIFFDYTMLYYEHEKDLIPFKLLRQKTTGINNTIADWPYSPLVAGKNRSILFIGRNTNKTNLTLLLDVAMKVDNIVVHLVGVSLKEVHKKYHIKNFVFHGELLDPMAIEKIAEDCNYFVYPGDVGLSIVHALKLGLVPLVHAKIAEHMPECKAVTEQLPIIFFQKDNHESLLNILKILICLTPNKLLKPAIASLAREKFSQDIMISKFSNVIKGN